MKKLLLLVPVVGLIGYSFFSESEKISKYHNDGIDGINFSGNPPAGYTGAPGDNGVCNECHTGSVMSADGVVVFTVSGGPNYEPGVTYPITISTAGGPKNGFQMTILDDADNVAGTFEVGPNTSLASTLGRNYIRHSSSLGLNSWTFNWTAPTGDPGNLTAYYSVVKANNAGGSSGDDIFMGSTPIPQVGASGIEENELDQAYNVFFNRENRTLNLNYSLLKDARVVLNVQDLSGRLVEYFDFGNQSSGDYNEILPLSKVDKEGIYLVSLFVDNQVLNRKVSLR